MDGERIERALTRIDQAADRIAALAQAEPLAAPDPDLAQRHEKLRDEAGAALAELDQLILALDR